MCPKCLSALLRTVVTMFWMLDKYLWVNLLKVVVVGPKRESSRRAGWYLLMKGPACPPWRLSVAFPWWMVNHRTMETILVCCRILAELN